jgi:hypothetical protein
MGKAEMRNAFNMLVGQSEGMRRLGRPRHRWEDNTRMLLTETGWEGLDRIHLTEARDQWRTLVNMVMNLWVL